MEKFLDEIEKHKFAILGTVVFHIIFFMSTNFVTIDRPYKIVDGNITEVEIETDAIEMDEEMLEMLNRQNELANNEQVYNLASDANDQRELSYENFSTQDIDDQVLNEARDLERQYFEEWAATHEGDGPPSSNNDNSSDEDNSNSEPNNRFPENNQVDNDGGNAFAGQVLVSFNLKDRNAHALEIPGYTCNGSGTVVIRIKVDKNGDVKGTEFAPDLSSGATQCMIDKAKRYARRARFDYNSGASIQNGTITYKFIGQ